jgi:hypothetical protein
MAGIHQLWSLRLHADPSLSTMTVLAGTTQEGLRDGSGPEAWLAQPSGLAAAAEGKRLWVADAETSALRSLEESGLTTRVGLGLFDFGHRDGPAPEALLQHPLGVTELPDGSVAVCDTYNGAVRRYDPERDEVTTLATGLAEPSDAVVEADDAGGFRLVVVESAAHRLVRVAIPADAQRVQGEARRAHRPPTALAAGRVDLVVAFEPPAGQKLDHRWGEPTRLVVSASPAELLLEGGGTLEGLRRTLTLAPGIPEGTLHVSVQAAACDTEGENPACHLFQQDWGIPLTLGPDAPSRLELDLRGT